MDGAASAAPFSYVVVAEELVGSGMHGLFLCFRALAGDVRSEEVLGEDAVLYEECVIRCERIARFR